MENLNTKQRLRFSRQLLVGDAAREDHDALVLNPERRLYRFAHSEGGTYESPAMELSTEDGGHRKVLNLAEGDDCHLALATLPIKEEPASQYLCCYLTNTARLYSTRDDGLPSSRDLLLINRHRQLFRFAADGTDAYAGTPEEIAFGAPGYSEALALADDEKGSKVAFAMLSDSLSENRELQGYFLNTPRLHYTNPWTSAAWSSHGALERVQKTGCGTDSVRVLLATSTSEVLYVELDTRKASVQRLDLARNSHVARLLEKGVALGEVVLADERRPTNLIQLRTFDPSASATQLRLLLATGTGHVLELQYDGEHASVSDVSLRDNVEVWRLLRNGCVAGRVTLEGADSATTLINLSSFSPAAEGHSTETVDLSGTFDFKWKPGSTLKVLVQAPSSYGRFDFQRVFARIEALAKSWTAGVNLQLAFEPVHGRLDLNQRYDILVNLERLPLASDAIVEQLDNAVSFPRSDLGSYARRRSFGQPTMFLGRPDGLLDPSGKLYDDESYFDEQGEAFTHIVLHEFGHALGLPHLHQHPELDNPFVEVATVQRAMAEGMGVAVDEDFVRDELMRRWVGNAAFSDWPALESVDALAEGSVMMGLPVQHVLKGRSTNAPRVLYRSSLGGIDRAWIQRLYPLH